LVTFPRGSAQYVAMSHDTYDLDQMEKLDIKLDNKQEMDIYLSKNRYNCKTVNIKSTAEDFLGDLELTLELLSILEIEERIRIQIPVIGMDLWRADH